MTKLMNTVLFGMAALLMASCSDSDVSVQDTLPSMGIIGLDVNTESGEALSSRVENLKGETRSVLPQWNAEYYGIGSMPEEPAIPETAQPLPNGQSVSQPGSYYVAAGETVTANTCMGGFWPSDGSVNIYVAGTMKIANIWGANSNSKIYILGGGTVEWENPGTDITLGSPVEYYNYGTLTTKHDLLFIGQQGALFNKGDLVARTKTIRPQGRLYVDGDLKVAAIDGMNSSSKVNATGDVLLADAEGKQSDLTIDGVLSVGGLLQANNITVSNSGKLYSGCGVRASKLFSMNGNQAEAHVQFLKADSIYQCACSQLYLDDDAHVKCLGGYRNDNSYSAFIHLTGQHALLEANSMEWNGWDANFIHTCEAKFIYTRRSKAELIVNCDKFRRNGRNETLSFDDVFFCSGNVISSKATDYEIAKTECDTTGYTAPEGVEKDPYRLDLISNVNYPDGHDHDTISATCVQTNGSKFYLSYHRRGKGHGACFEVFGTSGDATTLLQHVEDSEGDLDFNHLAVDQANNQLLLAGSSYKRGGMVAAIKLTDDGLVDTEAKTLGDTVQKPLQMVAFNAKEQTGVDANCIAPYGTRILVAATDGYKEFDSNLNLTAVVNTTGKAKHLAVNGNSVTALRLTETSDDTNAALAAAVDVFEDGQAITSTPSATFAVRAIAPNNGKNVVASDGDNIYVCLGQTGIACYGKDGSEKWCYTAPTTASGKVRGNANGCAVTDKFVYVAYGTYGIVVLDKATGKRLARRGCGSGSANYVSTDGENIYVAYGRNRLQVFHLIED